MTATTSTTTPDAPDGLVTRYLELGLALGRHIDGLVDAYYGPPDVAARVAAEPLRSPARLAQQTRRLLADIDGGAPLSGDSRRRHWLRAQVVGMHTTARRLAGETVSYADEVERCYGVRPGLVELDVFAEAHRALDKVVPGSGDLAERLIAWREAHAIDPEVLRPAVSSLAEELRERTATLFGLPEGEHIDFELVTDKPWAGFNTYLGDLQSRVDINTDLPVLSLSLGHLVAHEAYPGHHTEHSRKEVGLVRRRGYVEETVFLVGTPQCMLAEGLADLGLEIVVGKHPEPFVAAHLHPLGVRYDTEVAAAVAVAAESLSWVRPNAAWRIHQDGADPDVVVDELARWALLPRARARKAMEFLLHPTWRAYSTCYVEGLARCRRFCGGDPARFARLIEEQLTPADLGDTGSARPVPTG